MDKDILISMSNTALLEVRKYDKSLRGHNGNLSPLRINEFRQNVWTCINT
jgi:hypothetical protein